MTSYPWSQAAHSRLTAALSRSTPLTWVLAGDSITQGVRHTHGARSWAELLHERVRYELGRSRDILINTGVSGWTAPQVQADFDHLVGRFHPDVLSVALGMNDSLNGDAGLATFADSLGEIARCGLELDAVVILHTPNAIGHGAWNEPAAVASYAGVVRDLAAELAAILVDHHAHWLATYGEADPSPWLDEPVHPNAAGHRAMAQAVFAALGLD